MSRSRIFTGLVLAAFAGIFASQVASCTLDTEGTQPPVVTGAPCTVDANCDDNNPCTTEICPPATLVCEYANQVTGDAPNSVQVSQDCKTIVCNDGVPSTVDDPQDVINDNNSCTTDACVGGMPTNEVLMDGSSCKQGTKDGQCNLGSCEIACAKNSDCDDSNPCSDDLCNTSLSKCVYTSIDGLPTPGVMPVVGDCKLHICVGGIDTEINDEADINNDANPCTTDICTAGTPSNPPVPERTLCVPGDVKVCTLGGDCVECVVAADCVNIVETECEKRSCVNNTCLIAYEGQTTLASPVLQTAKDCNKIVCDGPNGTTKISDDMDLPDDGNPCTKNICTNGVPSNPAEAQNFNCGASQVCDGAGKCVGCTMASQCAGMDDFCKTRTCVSNVCGFSYTSNGTDLPTGQTTGDCKVLECDGAGNVKTSVLQSDVPVDGNQCTQDLCNMAGVPSNPATAINSQCSVGANDACDGSGNCKKSLGKMCNGAGAECVSTNCVDGVCCNNSCTVTCQACNLAGSVGTCSDVPKGQDDGTCIGTTVSCDIGHKCNTENGQMCTGGSTCLSTFCADGVCCDSSCGAACKSCNLTGSIGTCGNVPAGSQDNTPMNVCTGTNQCDGMGVCKRNDGAACMNDAQCINAHCVDSICCATTCTTDCKSCNVPGSLGTCSNVPINQDDGTCSGTSKSCDGMGGCKTETGSSCMAAGECFSGFCADGVCCNALCDTVCKSCAVTGTIGTCSNVPAMGQDTVPTNLCSGMSQCDGAGACKKVNSTSCTADAECLSGNCVDSVCCNSACTTDCKSCNVTGSVGTCTNVTNGTDDGMCTGATMSCDGAGACKLENGSVCAVGSDCLNSICVDGVCCNTACNTTCKSCNLTNTVGTCTNIPLNTNDDVPDCSGNNTCNGAGLCLKKVGQTCGADSECASNKCNNGNNMCQN